MSEQDEREILYNKIKKVFDGLGGMALLANDFKTLREYNNLAEECLQELVEVWELE